MSRPTRKDKAIARAIAAGYKPDRGRTAAEIEQMVDEGDRKLWCPDCGRRSLRLIETTDKDGDEYKEVRTCDVCEQIIYIVRRSEARPMEEESRYAS
jgi:hypothetical protein